jgi:hypothetical protein
MTPESQTCRHCGVKIVLVNYPRGPAWRHDPDPDRFEYMYCKLTVAEPEGDSMTGVLENRDKECTFVKRNGDTCDKAISFVIDYAGGMGACADHLATKLRWVLEDAPVTKVCTVDMWNHLVRGEMHHHPDAPTDATDDGHTMCTPGDGCMWEGHKW